MTIINFRCPMIRSTADHVFSHPLGLRLRLGPHPAVDIEADVPPGQNALGPFRAEKFSADEKWQDLPGEDLRQPAIAQAGDLMEDSHPVGPALGHQVVEVGVKIDPVPEGLDGRDDAGHKRTPGHRTDLLTS